MINSLGIEVTDLQEYVRYHPDILGETEGWYEPPIEEWRGPIYRAMGRHLITYDTNYGSLHVERCQSREEARQEALEGFKEQCLDILEEQLDSEERELLIETMKYIEEQ